MKENFETYALAGVGLARGVFEEVIQPEITAKRTWLTIGALVVAHEVMCAKGELLSEGWDKLVYKHPIASRALPLYLTAHTVNLLPKKLDLIHRLTN